MSEFNVYLNRGELGEDQDLLSTRKGHSSGHWVSQGEDGQEPASVFVEGGGRVRLAEDEQRMMEVAVVAEREARRLDPVVVRYMGAMSGPEISQALDRIEASMRGEQ